MELARGDGSVSTFHGVHSGLAMNAIALLGSEEQRERWLGPMARARADRGLRAHRAGPRLGRGHARDAGARLGDGYVIDGDKRWIGNAIFADLMVVWARDANGDVGAYVVEKGTAGRRGVAHHGQDRQARLVAGRHRARPTSACRRENRLEGAAPFDDAGARPDHGAARHRLGRARARGGGLRARPSTYVHEREQFGSPIAGYQLTQFRLAKMLADITACA